MAATKALTVRALTVDDLFEAIGIVCEVYPDPGGLAPLLGFAGPQSGGERGDAGMVVIREAVRILPRLTGEHRDRVLTFLASLVGLELDKFRTLPPATVMQVLRGMTARKEFPAFFEEFRSFWSGGQAPG